MILQPRSASLILSSKPRIPSASDPDRRSIFVGMKCRVPVRERNHTSSAEERGMKAVTKKLYPKLYPIDWKNMGNMA